MLNLTRFEWIISIVCYGLLALFPHAALAENANISGIWELIAKGVSTGCTSHTPNNYACGPFNMGDPHIHVNQSGNVITAHEGDTLDNEFTLNGTIDGSSIIFTISGVGITPGVGPATTTYEGELQGNIITGNFSGQASWSYDDGYGNIITETATWTGTFTVNIRVPVLLIQGLNVNKTKLEDYWIGIISALNATGIDHYELDCGMMLDKPEVYALQLKDYIENIKTTKSYSGKFDIVCHSYGAMVSRWYMEQLDGAKNIRQWIGIAPVNHGAAIADGSVNPLLAFWGAAIYVGGKLAPALQAMQTKSDELAKLNYNLDKFDAAIWKTSAENLSIGVIYRVLVGCDFMTACVNKNPMGNLYHYQTTRGDLWVPLFQSQLQGVGIDCFHNLDHNAIVNDPTVVMRVFNYLKDVSIPPLNNYPKDKDPRDHPPSLSAIYQILVPNMWHP